MKNKKLFYILYLCFLCFTSLPFFVSSNTESFSLSYLSDCYLNVGYHIDVRNDLAFVADNDGISVIDLSDPSNLSRLTIMNLPSAAFGVQIIGDYAYVACSEAGFYILDISDIYNPIILDYHDHEGTANKVYVQDTYAYVADYYTGLRIYDVSNKSDIVLECLYFDTGNIWDVITYDNIAYLANPYSIEVLNVSEPSTPVQLQTLSFSSDSTHLSIYEDKLFVGRHGQGINIYNITVPSTPVFISSYWDNDVGEELGLRANDTTLCVADNYGIEVFDISTPTVITKIAEYRDGVGAAHDLEFVDNIIYAVDGVTGIFALEIAKDSASTSESNFYMVAGILVLVSLAYLRKRR